MARFLGDSTVRFDAWIKQRTAEYRISNRRITKGGIAALSLFIKSPLLFKLNTKEEQMDER